MTSIDNAPASVRDWFAAYESGDLATGLRAALSPSVTLEFGGQQIHGIDAVVSLVVAFMPAGWLGEVEWNLLPAGGDGRVTVRGTGPDGTPLLVGVPGAPPGTVEAMDAMDFLFTLGQDDGGLITGLAGQPQYFYPRDLAQPLRPGDTAPDFVLPDVRGAEVALHQDEAAATVVVFTCNHCPWSLGWHDRIQQVARDYADRGVRFLQINSNDPAIDPEDGIENSRKRVSDGQFAGPYLIDHGQAVARRWGARNTPDVFLLDSRGIVAYHGAPDADVADQSLNAAWLRGALDHVLAGTTPDPASTQPVGCSIKWTM